MEGSELIRILNEYDGDLEVEICKRDNEYPYPIKDVCHDTPLDPKLYLWDR